MSDELINKATDFTISNKTYILGAYLHKEGEDPTTQGIQIPTNIIHLLVIKDNLLDPYISVEIDYESRFGLNEERTSVEDYYSEKSMQSIPPHYVYEGAGKDFIYINLISKLPEQETAKNKETSPYPILNTDFVIIKKTESVFRNVYDAKNGTITKLILMPVSQWNLSLSYPQWTTGFDTEYDKPSGKQTGLCIKELLEKSGMKIDSENFDLSGPTINLTSLINDSALDTIQKIMLRHACTDDNGDPCIFKYDHITDKYSLSTIKSYITHDQLNDDIGSFETIVLKNHAMVPSLPQITNVTPYASEITMDIESSLESITANTPVATISRHKSTFVIDARQYNTKETTDHIRDMYYNEPAFGGGMDSSRILNPFNTERTNQPMIAIKTPYWRNSERTSINGHLVYKKFFSGQTIKLNVPGYGAERSPGRKFNIRMYGGAIDEFTKRLLGTYLTTDITSELSPVESFYTISMVGVKIFPAKTETFSTQWIQAP